MSTFFQLILDDTSPVVNYYPLDEIQGVPDLQAGWHSYFSKSGLVSQAGERGSGDSFHVTSSDGAALTIRWFGTGISLFGSVVEAAYQVSIDGGEPSIGLPHQDLLVQVQNLTPKEHTLALTAHPTATSNTLSHLAFDRAVLNVSTGLIGASITSEVVNATSPRWDFSGDWTERSDLDITPQLHRVSNTSGSTASIAFTGSAITLMGTRNIYNGHYNVSLNGKTTAFNGFSDWQEASTLFLQAGLNETREHKLTITNADNATVAISGINITHVSGGIPAKDASRSGLPQGTIIGAAFAGICGILVVVTIATCMYFRQSRRRNDKPRFTSGGISSAQLFRDLDAPWSPVPKGRFSPVPKDQYTLRDLHSAPHTAGRQEEQKRNIPSKEGVNHALPIVDAGKEIKEPTGSFPDFMLPKISSTVSTSSFWGHEIKSNADDLVGCLTAHLQSDSGPSAITKPPSFHSRRPGTITEAQPTPLSRADIPMTMGDHISPLLTRGLRSKGSRRSAIRWSLAGAHETNQPSSGASRQDASRNSASAVQSAMPGDHRNKVTNVGTGTAAIFVDDMTPSSQSPLPPKDVSLDVLDREVPTGIASEFSNLEPPS